MFGYDHDHIAAGDGSECDMGRCALCGEHVYACDDPAEMHDAEKLNDPELYSEAGSGLVHAQCGLDAGWEVS